MDTIFPEALLRAVSYVPTVGVMAALSLIASFLIIFVSDVLYCGFKTRAVRWAPCIPGKSLLSERYRPNKSMDHYLEEFADAYRKQEWESLLNIGQCGYGIRRVASSATLPRLVQCSQGPRQLGKGVK
ncbi:hypothetical protein BDV27DRAFT_68944 [Aspergillus caelatus]|uniref:Uncharacterized protein n=1 Tax=Aspergillus caelatus TaxID=61420 RepID=A0A5N7AD69_9EURO|nr:uncharacterized protein BDV27DRAFT_68944 [Aspergillus caelatus]KAE8367645.1 hypothetical protein BDV27DRAFT_68944 [Aspergillus caelatus]